MDVDGEDSISIKARHGVNCLSHGSRRAEYATFDHFRAGPFAFSEVVNQMIMLPMLKHRLYSRLAQLVERVTSNDEVSRSSRLMGIFLHMLFSASM